MLSCRCRPIRHYPTTQGNSSSTLHHLRRAFLADPASVIVQDCARSAARWHLSCCHVSPFGPNLRCPRRSLPSNQRPCNFRARRCPDRSHYASTSSSSSFYAVLPAVRWRAWPADFAGVVTFCGEHFTPRSTTCTARAAGGSTGDEIASSGSGALVEVADEARLAASERPRGMRGGAVHAAAATAAGSRPPAVCARSARTSPASRHSRRPLCE